MSLAACLWYPSPVAADDGGYLAQLLERAERERLAERPEWHALLHYQPSRLPEGVVSEVDADGFFLSRAGKGNPRDELNATLQAFFHPGAPDPDDTPRCRFPARYHWLKEVLEFDQDRLPRVPCPRLERLLQEMKPGRITLVFPSAYLNNPASMFGHTLLRVDRHGESKETQLLAYTINYAADTQQQRGALYAFNGLFGRYQGRFSVAPYYAAVKTYGDIENRDIWEYGMNLGTEEVAQLLRHVWELRSARFDYFFIDENCSYHLLSLLEVARPAIRLGDRFKWWAIPSETVRAVAEAGLIDEIRFRPARNTLLQERMRLMESSLQDLAKGVSLGEVAADSDSLRRLDPLQQARVLELSLDYLAYRNSPRFGAKEQDPRQVSELLLARSRLEVPDQTPSMTAPEVWPGDGHKPARARVAYGIEERRQFVELAASPAYHDILDPEGGYTPGARITLFRGAVRYYPEADKAELEQLDLIELMSLSSWNRFMHPVSWKVALGVARKHPAVSDSLLLGKFSGGAGISHDLSRHTSAYAFAEGALELSDRFDFFAAPGLGPRVGILHDVSERWRIGASFLWQLFFLKERRSDYEAGIGNRYTLNAQNVAGLDLEWKREFGNSFPGVKLYWQHHF
ncbi:MAG: hypothetical protein A2075_20845 [Geobacteraceae bacterium GWC2_58_44]|nr:MAG: hypothetical protein A2075_20845 [Geobacteraceae bacterium GWC2_58_44]